jgi:hypothetical protein
MTMYWIYDYPNWLIGVVTVAVFVVVGLAGFAASRPLMRRLLGASPVYNELVSYVFAGVGVFYGLALGLIAVATYEEFNEVDGQVSREAADLTGLYRDLTGYPPAVRASLEEKLREYTRLVIEDDWPAHQRGEASEHATEVLGRFAREMLAFEPVKEHEKIVHAEVLHAYNDVTEQRRVRLVNANAGLPASLWAVVLIGAWLNIGTMYLFWVENVTLHAILIALVATFIGLLIYLTAVMDNPFRGEFCVSPDPFQMVLDHVMKPTTGR